MSTPEQQATTAPPTTPAAGAAIRQISTSGEGRILGLDEDGGLWRLLRPGERPGSVFAPPGSPPSTLPPVTVTTWEAIPTGRYIP